MSPFRRRSELKRVAGGPVFVDLGAVPLPEGDISSKIHLFKPVDEDALIPVRESLTGSNPVIVDMSGYVGDLTAAEDSMADAVTTAGRAIRRVGSDVWLIVSDDMVAEDI